MNGGVALGASTRITGAATRGQGALWVWPRGDELEWSEAVGGNGRVRSGRVAGWAELPRRAGQRLVVCLPGALVRVHRVRTPGRNRRRFMAALPFVLEDRLAQDVDACHLVPIARRRRELAVAVVARATLDALLEAARAAGHPPALVVADYLALPEPEEGVWTLDLTAQPAWLRHALGGAALGAVGTRPPPALLLALESAAPAPRRLVAHVADAQQAGDVATWREALAAHAVELDIVTDPRPRAARLAAGALPREPFNLLSGAYRDPARGGATPRRLLPAAALAAGVLLCAMLGFVLETHRLATAHDALTAALEQTYREAFPEARNVVDARFQMARRLDALRAAAVPAAGADRGLVGWLAALAPALLGADGVRVETLRFDGRSVTVEVVVPTRAALDALGAALARLGPVDVQDVEPLADALRGRLQLTRPA